MLGLIALWGIAAACGAGETRPVLSTPRASGDAGLAPVELPPAPPQYVLADGPRPAAVVPIDRAHAGGACDDVGPCESARALQGVILDGLRLVSTGGGVRGARDVADPALVAAERVPKWLGGGFLFRSTTAIYLADAFDGALRPVVTMPAPIERVSFGPKFVLVRATSGERWALDLPSGKRARIAPAGLVEVAAVEGRAAAITDAGAALVSTDGGEKWTDVSAQLRGRPERVGVFEEAVWIVENGGAAMRVDSDRLSFFDRAPAPKAVDLRPRDPRWHAEEPPIRRAIRLGLPIDDHTAIVASEGDIVRVNVTTGEIVTVTPGRVPPDATCEALRSQDEIIFACTRPTGGAFVASHIGGERAPIIEQTFAANGQFFAGDDGSLAFGGPCARPKPSHLTVCVRGPGGTWQENDVEGILGDAGSGADVLRWIPRADGGAFGFVAGQQPGMIDAKTGELRAWQLDALPPIARQALTDARARGVHATGRVIDRVWTATPNGGLRGWSDGGAAVDVAPEGTVTVSPFTFDRVVVTGSFAFAKNREGRVWQTLDRGATWAEVAPPPTAQGTRGVPDPRLCSAVGCDLGTWYRIGWTQLPPAVSVAPSVAPPPARLARAELPVMTCRRAGDAKSASVPRSDSSPEDLGLGAARIPTGNDSGTLEFVRMSLTRALLNPPHGATDARDTDFAASRVVVHGPQTESAGEDRFTVVAPNHDPMSLRRSLAFVAPFDPTGAVRRTQIGTPDAVAAARAAGMHGEGALREDMTALQSAGLVTPLDPAAPGDLIASSQLGLLAVLRAQPPRAKVAVRVHMSEDAMPISAAQIGADEFAVLELEASGRGVVYRIGPNGSADLFDVPAPPRGGLYPANADAVALGPKNEVATLRLSSGSDPPGSIDPAILSFPGSPPLALAAWSTLLTADAPECRAETGGWRATIATLRPWVRVGGDVKVEDEAPMFARVRWSASRVCLEAIELRVPDTEVKVFRRAALGRLRSDAPQPDALTPEDASLETWLVVRSAGAPAAARVIVVPGFEMRQGMLCTL